MMKQIKIFEEKIRAAKSIVIMGHKNPDGDSLCSVLAVAHLLKQNFKKKVVCVYDGNIPDNLDNVPLREDIHFYERLDANKKFDVAIVLDYGTPRNIGGPSCFIESAGFVIEIDHHLNDDKVGALCIDDEHAAATAEIVYEIMTKAKWKCDISTAVLLMTGIITDTGHFVLDRKSVV